MKKNKGITLMELLIVIAIISVFLIMSFSIGRGFFQRSSFGNVINQFLADFNYAKQLASRENRYSAIIFNADGSSYSIYSQKAIGDLNNWNSVKTTIPLEGKIFFDKNKTQDFAVNSQGAIVKYPIVSNDVFQINLNFFKLGPKGVIDYQKNIKIYPYGGIKIE